MVNSIANFSGVSTFITLFALTQHCSSSYISKRLTIQSKEKTSICKHFSLVRFSFHFFVVLKGKSADLEFARDSELIQLALYRSVIIQTKTEIPEPRRSNPYVIQSLCDLQSFIFLQMFHSSVAPEEQQNMILK